jgi:hypothetical protein
VGAHGLLQEHTAVRGGPCVTPESGLDFGTTLRDHLSARGLYGDDASQELVQAREMLAPEVVDAPELLERSALESPTDALLRGSTDAVTMMDAASFSGGNSPSRRVLVTLDLSPRRLC